MNADPTGPQAGPGAEVPSEAELRAAYEAELARITATDMIAQSAVSLTLRAVALGERDLD